MEKVSPIIINYSNLNSEDKKIIQGKLGVLETIKKERKEFIKDAKHKDYLSKVLYDVAIEVLSELEEKVKEKIILVMTEMIDSYDQCVEEQDTDDYFYGWEGEIL